MPTIDQLNALSREAFTARLGSIYEHSPWIAESAWEARPFSDADQLIASMRAVVDASALDAKLALPRAHPDLAGKLAVEDRLTAIYWKRRSNPPIEKVIVRPEWHVIKPYFSVAGIGWSACRSRGIRDVAQSASGSLWVSV